VEVTVPNATTSHVTQPSVLGSLTLALPDVAALARVQRPVVSMWRTRHADGATPFPAPVSVRAGQPRFRATDVADWIEATGLGNNREFRADMGRHAELGDDLGLDDDVAFDGLTALLCLATVADTRLSAMSRAELLDLADDADPDDAFCYSEVEALGSALGQVAEHAELVASAAFSTSSALEALVMDRRRLPADVLRIAALAPAALDLVGALVTGLLGALPPGARVVNPYPGCGDAVVAVRRALGEDARSRVVLAPAQGADRLGRLARRRLLASRTLLEEVASGAPGSGAGAGPSVFEVAGPAVVVTQLPPTGTAEMPDADVLTALDDIALSLAPGQRAVVVGPASALCGTLRGEADRARAAVLRTDRVRSIVRLPAGLVPSRSRQELALWVLGDAHLDAPIAQRWTTVADLSAVRPGPEGFPRDVVDDLVADVLAAQGSRAEVNAHAFRFARFARTSALLAAGRELVAVGRPLARGVRDDAGATAARLHELVVAATADLPPVAADVAAGEPGDVRTTTLGALAEAGAVRVVPGNRVDAAHVGGEGDVAVVGVAEILGDRAWGSRRVDRLTFSAAYDAGRYSAPGDIVFCTSPYPAAVLDTEGFGVVEYPARVLRVDPGSPAAVGLVPRVVVQDVNAQAGPAKRWRSWEVRLVEEAQAEPLGALLDALAARRAALLAELERLEEVAALASSGVASRSVRLGVQNA
jgi:hypothetical protein